MRAVFTAEALEDPAPREPGPPPGELHTFGPASMKSPSSEESLLVARAPKLSYASPVAFYLAVRELAPTGLGSLCRAIDEETALARVRSRLAGLREPIRFELRSRFIAAMQMSAEWDSDVILIETERDYIVVSWDTTA